jgi:hypothetical protein
MYLLLEKQRSVVLTTSVLSFQAMAIKDPGKSGIYSFCFHFESTKVSDERVMVTLENPLTDYSPFSDAWSLIKEAMG